MPLTAGSELGNIRRSVDAFVKANIETGLSVPVSYDRRGEITSADLWVRMNQQRLAPQTRLTPSGNGLRGQILDYAIDFNCFARREAVDRGRIGIYRLDQLADSIAGILTVNVNIPIRDYDEAGDPIVNILLVHGIPDQQRIEVPAQIGWHQVDVRVRLRYTEETT